MFAHGAVALLAGCTAVLDADRPQCSTDGDCANRGGAFAATVCVESFCQAKADPKWGCLGNVTAPDGGAGPFRAGLRLVDAITQQPLAGVQGQPCRKLDVACSAPLAEAKTSDADGVLTFLVERGFDGYVSLTDPRYAPTLYFINPPIFSDREPKLLTLSSPGVMALFAQQIGAQVLPDRGDIFLVAEDCQGNATEGVSYATTSADSSTLTFYVVGMLPTAKTQGTDATGFGGLVNVPTGVVTVSGTVAAAGRNVANLGLLVRASTVTYTSMVPLAD